jgi:hypothetical protein
VLNTLDPQHQLERVLAANEALYAKWRRRPPTSQPTTLVFADPEPITPQEQAHVREVVASAAVGLDADPGDLQMVLDALGVLPPPPPANVTNLPAKRRYGQCRYCHRTSIALRKDGLLTGHSRIHHTSVSEARCDGGGTLPARRKAAA